MGGKFLERLSSRSESVFPCKTWQIFSKRLRESPALDSLNLYQRLCIVDCTTQAKKQSPGPSLEHLCGLGLEIISHAQFRTFHRVPAECPLEECGVAKKRFAAGLQGLDLVGGIC